jgi:hypothetical protein
VAAGGRREVRGRSRGPAGQIDGLATAGRGPLSGRSTAGPRPADPTGPLPPTADRSHPDRTATATFHVKVRPDRPDPWYVE